jgi:hypothetical protein
VRSPAALQLLWSSGTGGGPAIVAAGLIWTIGQNGVLYGLSPATGQVRQQASIGAPANHFPTPSVADGLLLAPTADQVVAFTASASGAAGTPSTATNTGTGQAPASRASSPPAAAAPGGGGLPAGAITGLVVAGLLVISGAGWVIWRRRTTGPR